MYDFHKIFDGPFTFCSTASEDEIRDEVVRLLLGKKVPTHDSDHVDPDDFCFIRCVNKRVSTPDGDCPVDGVGVRQVYPHGSVYVRLCKEFAKGKVCSCYYVTRRLNCDLHR